jgi:hypothetical protein
MRFRDGSDKETATVHQILSDNTTYMSRVITGDESCIYGYNPETKQKSPRWKWRAKSSACSLISLTSRGKFTNNSSWHTNSQFRILLYRFTATAWKCEKTSSRNLAAKELAVASQQTTVSHFHFSPANFFYQKMTDVPHPPYFSCFPDWR